MKKIYSVFSIFLLILISLSSCASSKIRGANPVQRAHSAAQLLLQGSTADAYIKQFNIEMDKAKADINEKTARVNLNPESYEVVADSIDDWLQLYELIAILESRYPNGLYGKKQSAFFSYVDYKPLKETANQYTAEKYFKQARAIAERPHSLNETISAVEYLHKSLNYSNHLLEETQTLGASLSYEAALKFYETKTSDSLKNAHAYFLEAESWIAHYADARERANNMLPEIATILISEADSLLGIEDYSRLRKAYLIYEEAFAYYPSLAEEKLKKTKEKLTITVALIFSGANPRFIHDDEIRDALENNFANTTEGPKFVHIDFIYTPYATTNHASFLSSIISSLGSQSTNLKKNYSSYDLVLIPGPKFNTAIESIENPVKEIENIATYYRQTTISEDGDKQIFVSEVSKNEYTNPKSNYTDGNKSYQFIYWKEEGTITRYVQKVSLFMDYSYELYDIRNNFVDYMLSFDRNGDKLDLEFVQESYVGPANLQPEKLRNDAFYMPGQNIWYAYKIPTLINPYQIIDTSYNQINENGRKLFRQIRLLSYKAK
jgi:hypothetical protein